MSFYIFRYARDNIIGTNQKLYCIEVVLIVYLYICSSTICYIQKRYKYDKHIQITYNYRNFHMKIK